MAGMLPLGGWQATWRTTMPETIESNPLHHVNQSYKELSASCTRRFLATYSKVPADKLNWSPTPEAKSAFQIAAHVAASHEFFVMGLQGQSPAEDFPGVMKWIDEKAEGYKTQEEVLASINASQARLEQLYDEVGEEILRSRPEDLFYLHLGFRHTDSHAAQIDYLQTCWGDYGFYFGN